MVSTAGTHIYSLFLSLSKDHTQGLTDVVVFPRKSSILRQRVWSRQGPFPGLYAGDGRIWFWCSSLCTKLHGREPSSCPGSQLLMCIFFCLYDLPLLPSLLPTSRANLNYTNIILWKEQEWEHKKYSQFQAFPSWEESGKDRQYCRWKSDPGCFCMAWARNNLIHPHSLKAGACLIRDLWDERPPGSKAKSNEIHFKDQKVWSPPRKWVYQPTR